MREIFKEYLEMWLLLLMILVICLMFPLLELINWLCPQWWENLKGGVKKWTKITTLP